MDKNIAPPDLYRPWYRHLPYAAALFAVAAMGGLIGSYPAPAKTDAASAAIFD